MRTLEPAHLHQLQRFFFVANGEPEAAFPGCSAATEFDCVPEIVVQHGKKVGDDFICSFSVASESNVG